VKPLLFANFLAPNMTPVYTAVAARVGCAVGVPAELIEGRDFEQLRDGSVDLAFLCGLPYVRLAQQCPGMLQPLAAPVLDEARYQDRPIYFSDVIVRGNSRLASFSDLRGCRWAYNDPASLSGCLLVRYHLLQIGETEAFFGSVTFTGRHQESIRRVVAGELDASAIDSQVLSVEFMRNPALKNQVRVIAVLGPSTIPPVVATGRVPGEIRVLAGDAICALGGDAADRDALASGLIRRFTPVEDRSYDDIRHKMAAVEGSARSH
jgi:phosphonate transport system substrate-binding protein